MKITKLFFYELDPNWFAQHEGNFCLKGITKKSKYFEFIKVNYLIINNLFAKENKTLNLRIESHLGNWNDLSELIVHNKKYKTKIGVTIDITEFVTLFSNRERKNREYGEFEIIDHNIDSQNIFLKFVKLIHYELKNLASMGLKVFIIKDRNSIFKNFVKTPNLVKEIIELTKLIDYQILIVNQIKYLQDNLFFDYYLPFELSELNNDIFEKKLFFKTKNNFLKNKILLNVVDRKQNIIYFYPQKSGRINTLLCDNFLLNNEVSKAIILLQFLLPNSLMIKYGDELGYYTIPKKNLSDFKLDATKKDIIHFQAQGFNDQEILNHLNHNNDFFIQQPFFWTKTFFKQYKKDNSIFFYDKRYEYLNLKWQKNHLFLIFTFFKKMRNWAETFFQKEIIQHGINTLLNGVIEIIYLTKDESINCFLNLSVDNKKIKPINKFEMIASSYGSKRYYNKITNLDAFEAILIKTNSKGFVSLSSTKKT